MQEVGVVGASRGTRVFRYLCYFLAESRDYSQSSIVQQARHDKRYMMRV